LFAASLAPFTTLVLTKNGAAAYWRASRLKIILPLMLIVEFLGEKASHKAGFCSGKPNVHGHY
jgi:hypothetical protein